MTNKYLKPKIGLHGRTTIHYDGSVSYWNVYRMQWCREMASQIEDKIMASLPDEDRERIKMAAEKPPRATFTMANGW